MEDDTVPDLHAAQPASAQQVVTLVDLGLEACAAYRRDDLAPRLRAARQRLADPATRVLVVGEAAAGDGQRSAEAPAREPPFAEISDIEVDEGRYVLTYESTGFTPMIDDAGAYHVHFFWDPLPVINAGSNGPDPGSWLLWDTPFEVSDAFFDAANRPEGSRQICVVIADSGHAVADVTRDGEPDTGTGDCIDLPDG